MFVFYYERSMLHIKCTYTHKQIPCHITKIITKYMKINNLKNIGKLTFLLFLINSCSSNIEVNCSELTSEEGLVKLNDKKFNGMCLVYFNNNPNLIDEKRSYKRGLMHGKWIKNHKNGNLFYSSYAKNGEIHGKYVSYHLNGNIADRGKLKKGYKVGNWEYFDQNGKLLKTELYKNKTLMYERNY